ncbi:Secondary metabolism regulator LAE1 [Colletotrichum orbiculare MAFF 240422]|uniref:Secondary metabolism regulator LAE1 n=1 Tax=Colletotrichum orbiculare (strain 104-T / ATCC 96160 / CBS 514.97 / LARS 414 / MAFF 240422) TaxID=1213857 RepID=A0A484FCC2_COLOR|nr:Secondary metabolism regulator LAE1 [Colletotrichum orbiculare MAFF 240422]
MLISQSKTASLGAASEPDEIEVDNGVDATKTLAVTDDQLSSYTASLSSSVADYPTENGRQYHAFRAGSYYGPNDHSELDRLDYMSSLIYKTIGKLYYAPIEQDKTHRILDIGTGSGIWAIEMAELFPSSKIIGNDLSGNQPTWIPPNVQFVVDDVESPCVDDEKYDYVFCRSMAGALGDWPKLVQNVYNNTNPGGWVEFQDWDLLYRSDDGTLTENHESLKMVKGFIKLAKQIGREPNPGPQLQSWVTDVGFKKVIHKKFKIPIGPWPKDPHYKELGMRNMVQILEGLEAYNLRIFTGVGGWSAEEVQVMMARCRDELRAGLFHASLDFHVVYAQKPVTAEE